MPPRSPREILLARHAGVTPQLDRARAAALAAVFPRVSVASLIATFWREVFQSHLKAWAGLAAVWLILGALHLSSRSVLSGPKAESAVARQELLAAWASQRRLLAEISQAKESTPAPAAPRPAPAKPPGRTSATRQSSHHA